jgi:lysophospholipase L1-like esterase
MRYLSIWIVVLAWAGLTGGQSYAQTSGVQAEMWDWPAAMKKIAAKYTGKPGMVVPMGDSITYANQAGRWARYGKGKTAEEQAVSRWMNAHKNDKANGWWLAANDQPRGRSWTAASGCNSAQYLKGGKGGLPSLDAILKKHNPQIATILLGTNDLSQKVKPEIYLKNMEMIYTKCMAHGTIPIVQTVPPTTWDKAGYSKAYNEGLVKLAAKHKLPLIDVHAEFLKRRPGDSWKGTLVSKDGAHLTHAVAAGPATDQNLKNDGNLLRCWLQVRKIMQIKTKVLAK